MNSENALHVARAFLDWLHGKGSLDQVEFLLGDKLQLLSRSLRDSLVADASGNPFDDITHEEATLAFTIFLAMRHAILKSSVSVSQRKF